MQDFELHIPTKMIFGKNALSRVGEETAALGKKALLISGKGTSQKSGLAERVRRDLTDHGLAVEELVGVSANPRLTFCERGVSMCRERGVDVLVAVGGGSVNDTAKTIAVGAAQEGDLWEYYEGKLKVTRALPIVTIMTVAATGSEFNPISVLVNDRTKKKAGMSSEHLYPRVAILDPQVTFTVPPAYTALGSMDMITHVLEAYVDAPDNPLLSQRLVEALIRTIMEETVEVLKHPADYNARSSLMYASSLACSGMLVACTGWGKYPAHQIGAEIEAAFDIPHGASLSVIMPAMMRQYVEGGEHIPRIARFAEMVMMVERRGAMTDRDIALAGIERFRDWLRAVGNPVTLKQLGVSRNDLERLAHGVEQNHTGPDFRTTLRVLEAYHEERRGEG